MKNNLKNPKILIIINLHSLDKISAELESVAANEGLTKIEAGAGIAAEPLKRIQELLEENYLLKEKLGKFSPLKH